jgi:hypothetical protein
LNVKEVGSSSIEALRPQVIATFGFDQLDRNPQTFANGAQAA